MKKTMLDVIKLALPVGKDKKELLRLAALHLTVEEMNDLRYFLKMDKLFGIVHDYETSKKLPQISWPEFKTHVGDKKVKEFIKDINKQIKEATDEETFTAFTKKAKTTIPELIANNIVGLEKEKFVGALTLFAKQPFHTLLLGDPGTGKTEIVRSVAALSPKGSFGLGSGTTGAGLSAVYKGDELILGLLPQADNGVACIDELNLMKAVDRASLYSAMEKGFITYDKGGKHKQLNARVRVIATANPKGDKFVGKGAAILKKQVPFKDALLSRFSLVFLIRKPSTHELGKIARKIVRQGKQQLKKGDVTFVKEYVKWSWEKNAVFPKKFEPMIVNFIEDLHEDQKKFLVEVGPRTVIGIIRVAKAYARMQGKEEVEQKDLITIMNLFKDSYYVRK